MFNKTIGVLGGMGPVATAEFYSRLLKVSQEEYNSEQDNEYPHIIIDSLSIKGSSEQGIEDYKSILEQMMDSVNRLIEAGSEIIAIPCNSEHNLIEKIQDNSGIPMINMVKIVLSEVVENRSKRPLLFASLSTYKDKIYQHYSEDSDLKIIEPSEEVKKVVERIILEVMRGGNYKAEKKYLLDYIKKQVEDGIADSAILGCTELPVAIKEEDSNIKIYDSLEILAVHTLQLAKQ